MKTITQRLDDNCGKIEDAYALRHFVETEGETDQMLLKRIDRRIRRLKQYQNRLLQIRECNG